MMMLPRILSVATAVPAFKISQSAIANFAKNHFQQTFTNSKRIQQIFQNVQVHTRYLSAPLPWFKRPHSFVERNELYLKVACKLGEQAARECLKNLFRQIKHFVFVSSTGIATPTLDARLLNVLKMPLNVKRTPIWGLGCLGGVAGLVRATDFVRGEGKGCALLLTVELCSLTFQKDDLSKSNLIAASLFGDGAASVVVGYSENGKKDLAPAILGSASMTWPHSLDVMGWEIVETGLQVIFSKKIPDIVKDWLKEVVENFLSSYHLKPSDIAHYIAHPGGAKVLDAFQETFRLKDSQICYPRKVLRYYGNLSSCSVLFVLKELLEGKTARAGDYGLISALGPGFSTELMLIQWR